MVSAEIVPKLRVGNITINYDQQGSGEPLVLIPYLAADCACYAFQVAELREAFHLHLGRSARAGGSREPTGVYSTEMFADDVAALMQTIGIHQAHIYGLSLGAARGMWLAAQISRPGQVTIAAQRMAKDRCLLSGRSCKVGR